MARKGYPMPVRYKTLELVAMGYSDAEVGSQVGIPQSTVRRWRVDPRNTQILENCQRELIDRLEENAKLATAHLRGVLTDSEEEPTRQMTAAIQSLKAHSKAVQAGAAKKIGDAVERATTPDELTARRTRVMERLADSGALVFPPSTMDGDPDDN